MVYGYASTPQLDSDGEVVEVSAIERALPEYMKFPTIREMHQPKVAGTTVEASIDNKGLFIGAKVVSDEAWKLVKEGVYRGFSIGGKVRQKVRNYIKDLDLTEISLVDVPANKGAVITLWKSDGTIKDTSDLTVAILEALPYENGSLEDQIRREVIRMEQEKEVQEQVEEVEEEVAEDEQPENEPVEEVTEDVEEQEAVEDVEAEPKTEAEAEDAEAEAEEAADEVVDEGKEASGQPSDITKLEKRIEALELQLAERIEKVSGNFAKADAVEALGERITKLEKQPMPVKASQSYTVVNKSVAGIQETPSRIDEINKRLAEIDAIKATNLPVYQSQYMSEALGLVEEKRQLEANTNLRGGENE